MSPTDNTSNLKCLLVAELCKIKLTKGSGVVPIRPRFPVLVNGSTIIFGANSICKYLAAKTDAGFGVGTLEVDDFLEFEEVSLQNHLRNSNKVIG